MKFLYTILTVLFAEFLLSCSTKYVPVDTVRIDSVRVVQQRVDSIYERDSIYVYVNADTVWMTKTQTRYRDRILRDTIRCVERDTVRTSVEVERSFSRMERLKMDVGGAMLWVFIGVAAVIMIWLIRKFKGI